MTMGFLSNFGDRLWSRAAIRPLSPIQGCSHDGTLRSRDGRRLRTEWEGERHVVKVRLPTTLSVASALTFILVAGSCSSGGSASSSSTRPSAPTAESPSSTAVPANALVGRWRSERTCQDLVDALDKAGLAALAPWIVGEYVSGTPEQLAQKKNICQGGQPSVHYHFFTADGQFGSLDGQANQVDNGTYRITGSNTVDIPRGPPDFLSIVHVTFRFTITDGDKLTLDPILSPSLKRKALAAPTAFSAAGWAFAVTDGPTHVWTRVPCAGWC